MITEMRALRWDGRASASEAAADPNSVSSVLVIGASWLSRNLPNPTEAFVEKSPAASRHGPRHPYPHRPRRPAAEDPERAERPGIRRACPMAHSCERAADAARESEPQRQFADA